MRVNEKPLNNFTSLQRSALLTLFVNKLLKDLLHKEKTMRVKEKPLNKLHPLSYYFSLL
ncbi:hypothetical protein PNI02_26620 [Pseudoalteromonas nigrifaciens]|nr:hypothetical protein PNI02_26620 [Pseudoalteromonas nigrifaciens]